MTLKNNIDDALTIVGYGRWQVPVFLLSVLSYFLIPVHMVGSPFLSVPLPFRCFSSPNAPLEVTSHFSPNTTTTNQPPAVIYDSKCGATEQNVSIPAPLLSETGLPSCPFVEYDHSTFPSTVVSEFHLVCERSSLRPVFQILISLGALLGSPLGGVIGDKYGRRTVVITGGVVNAVGVVVMVLCPWYSLVLISRFIVGVTGPFLILSAFNLSQEVTPPRFRSQTGMLAGLGFSVGIVVLAGMAYLVRPWRYLMLTASFPLLVIIPLACLVEESPRWLAQKGRQREAAEALTRAARHNRVAITPELLAALDKLKAEKNRRDEVGEADDEEVPTSLLGKCFSQCRSYLHYSSLRRIVLITPFIWYLQSLFYLGIILNANNFTSNDPFVYMVVSGAMDLSALVLSTPLTIRFGRRYLSAVLFFFGGTFLLLDLGIPAELAWLKWVFVMGAFLLSSASYQVLFIYTPELFPTVIRSRGFGMVNGMGSLGLLTAPIITDLLVQKVWWAVHVVCGLAGLFSCLLITFLPETRNLPLPEKLQDMEKRRHNNRRTKDSKMMEEQAINEANSPLQPTSNMESESSA